MVSDAGGLIHISVTHRYVVHADVGTGDSEERVDAVDAVVGDDLRTHPHDGTAAAAPGTAVGTEVGTGAGTGQDERTA